jgi:hypothetical protein
MNNVTLDTGRSGCEIQLIKDKNSFIRKISPSNDYNVRLKSQYLKQNEFKFKSFKIPKIYDKGVNSKGLFFFDMEYVHGYNVCDFFSFISPKDVSEVYLKLENFLEFNFKSSKHCNVESLVKKKVNDLHSILKSNLNYSESLKKNFLSYLQNNIPNSKIPVGYCHGDLTFSNVLFKNNKEIYLIDFLDSFIDSPIIDLVKIRQDTRFFWTLLINRHLPEYKILRLKQIFNYLDLRLQNFIDSHKEIKLWYDYLEILNLVRIMPYVTEKSEIKFLKINLNKLVKKL